MLSKGLSASLGSYLKGYCTMFNLRIDSQNRCMIVDALPLGEKEPITLTLHDYALESGEAGALCLRFERVSSSREWIARVIEAALPEKRLELPDGVPLGLLKTVI